MKSDTPRVNPDDIKNLLERKFKEEKKKYAGNYFTLCDTGDELKAFFAAAGDLTRRMSLSLGVEFHEELLMGVRVVRQETPYALALRTTLYYLEFTEFI